MLIERGADVSARNSRGESALDLCLHDEADRDELAEVIEALLARGAVRRPDATDADASARRAGGGGGGGASDGGSSDDESSAFSSSEYGDDDDDDDDLPDQRAD